MGRERSKGVWLGEDAKPSELEKMQSRQGWALQISSLPLWGRAGVGASHRASLTHARSKPRQVRPHDLAAAHRRLAANEIAGAG